MPRIREVMQRTNGAPRAEAPEPPPPEEPQIDEDACSRCGGVGFVRRDVSLDHPDFGKAVPCRCVQLEGVEARQLRLQRYSNLGPLTRLTFENLVRSGRSTDPRDRERLGRCVEDAEAFAQDPQGWLVLVGASGCGKTHIAAAIANRCIERGIPAFFVVIPDLLDHLRATFRPDADIDYDDLFEQVRTAPVLILDDLGAHNTTAWAQEKLFQIINDRFNARLPTVITTNEPLRKLDPRLRARLGDPEQEQPHADPIARVHLLEQPLPREWQELSLLGLPEIREMTWTSFDFADALSPRDARQRQDAHRHALGYAEDPQGWFVLVGGRERDRTHILAAMANHRRALGEFPLFARVAELLEFLRHSMYSDDPEDDYYKAKKNLRSWPLLLLDDLEIGQGSEYSRRELFELLYWRYLGRLPTVISTPSQLTNLLHDPGWSRLAGLMRNAASFCSEIPMGEKPPEAEIQEAKQPARSVPPRSRRKPN